MISTKNTYRYYRVCPRGFANEVTYIRVREDEIAAVEKHFDSYEDRMFDKGHTDASCGWTDDPRAHRSLVSWDDYLKDRW